MPSEPQHHQLNQQQQDPLTTSIEQKKVERENYAEPQPIVNRDIDAAQLMPTDSDSLYSLENRAKSFAQPLGGEQSVSDYQDYIRFRLGDNEFYGIPYEYVEQIISAERLTKVPCTPDYIGGVINWRGLLLSVIDIGKLFHASYKNPPTQSSIIVVSDDNMTVGMLVDEIEENDVFSPSQLEAALLTGQVNNIAFVKGIFNGRVTILDVGNILSDKQITINKN